MKLQMFSCNMFGTVFDAINYIIMYTCISGAFLPVVYVCDLMSELFHQNKFLITTHIYAVQEG